MSVLLIAFSLWIMETIGKITFNSSSARDIMYVDKRGIVFDPTAPWFKVCTLVGSVSIPVGDCFQASIMDI